MTTSSVFRRSAAATAMVAAAFGFSANANAGGLKAGECYTNLDAMRTVLAQEGQKPVIVGNRMSPESKNQNANFIFVNPRGYGYNIEGDKPYGQALSKMCVVLSFKDAHFNSPDNPEIPSWGKFVKPNGNGIDVVKAYENGGRLVLGAQSYTVKAGGIEVPGKYIMVMVDSKDAKKFSSAWAVDFNGNASTNLDMTDTQFTQHMNEYLAPRPVAAVSAPALVAAR